MYNRDTAYILVIYLCGGGNAVCDELKTQIKCNSHYIVIVRTMVYK